MSSVRWEDRPGGRWVQLAGQLDFEGCSRIGRDFDAAFVAVEGDVTVDLSGVSFLSSHGIRLLLQAYRGLKGKGRVLRVTGLSSTVRRVFDITGLFQAIPEA